MQTNNNKLVFLGTGTSHGVPMIGCNCDVCKSNNPKNKRTRTSVCINTKGKTILIDTSPDFHNQAIKNNLNKIDAVLITHDHADHLHGIDDIRPLCSKTAIPLFSSEYYINSIKNRFDYIFKEHNEGGGVPKINLIAVKETFQFDNIPITPIPLLHGSKEVFGFRIGNIAYCTDCNYIPEPSINLLKNLDVLIIDALRYTPHSTHFSVDEALEEIKRIKPRIAYFTHMCHNIDHDKLAKELPHNVYPAFDGLEIIIN